MNMLDAKDRLRKTQDMLTAQVSPAKADLGGEVDAF